MESFSKKVKQELVSSMIESEKTASYEFLALLIYSNFYNFEKDSFFISQENNLVTQRLLKLSKFFSQNNKKNTLLNIEYKFQSEEIKKNIYLPIDIDLKNIESISIDDLFVHSFLRGIFLACGSIVNPENEYHLEFCISDTKLKDIFVNLIVRTKFLKFEPKIVIRRNNYVVYSKSAEKITDFLVFIGAKKCAMEFMQVKMIKEVRNNINRTTNFETANITKTTNSATTQIEAIKKIKKAKKFDDLTDQLKEVAILRLENPYSSLEDLSKKSGQKISKSGINHRLQKIIETSKTL